jgi:hypothetical protein
MPLVTASQLGLPQLVCIISAPQLRQRRVSSAEYRGLHDPSRRPTAVVLPPAPLVKVFLLLRWSRAARGEAGSPDRRAPERL